MSQSSASDLPAACDSNAKEEEFAELRPVRDLCDEIVDLINSINSPDGPYNQAEATQASEAETQAASQYQGEIIDHLEYLTQVVAYKTAACEDEIDAKIRARVAITSMEFSGRESFLLLPASIQRDWQHLAQAHHKLSPMRSFPQNWFTSRFANYSRIAR